METILNKLPENKVMLAPNKPIFNDHKENNI